jgi:hypothetical protein
MAKSADPFPVSLKATRSAISAKVSHIFTAPFMGLHPRKTIPLKVGGLRPRRDAMLDSEKSSTRQETSVEIDPDPIGRDPTRPDVDLVEHSDVPCKRPLVVTHRAPTALKRPRGLSTAHSGALLVRTFHPRAHPHSISCGMQLPLLPLGERLGRGRRTPDRRRRLRPLVYLREEALPAGYRIIMPNCVP